MTSEVPGGGTTPGAGDRFGSLHSGEPGAGHRREHSGPGGARALLDLTGHDLRAFWRAHRPSPPPEDVLLVVALGLVGIIFPAQVAGRGHDGATVALSCFGVALFALPFLWRRAHPMGAAIAVAAAHLLQVSLVPEPTVANVSAPIAVYTVARWSDSRGLRRGALLLALAGSLIAGVQWAAEILGGYGSPMEVLGSAAFIAMMCLAITGSSWLFGALVRQRAQAVEQTREKALAVERGRVQNIQIAAQEERARIAREMHDVVAHSLSVIVVQSDGGAYALDTALERAAASDDPQVLADALRNASAVLGTIGTTARESLADTRRLVSVLRQDEGDAEYAPTGGVDSLCDLLDPLRAAGLSIATDVTGRPRPLSRTCDLAVYRVVQEALTNVIKHAGDARVWVSLDYLAECLLLTIRDDGAGVTSPPDGAGHGLVGMKERLAAVGGGLWAGGAPGGGFVVEARIPYDAGSPRGAGDLGEFDGRPHGLE